MILLVVVQLNFELVCVSNGKLELDRRHNRVVAETEVKFLAHDLGGVGSPLEGVDLPGRNGMV